MGVPFKIVIEPQEFAQYANVIDEKNILVLPFGNLGQGSIPARNWIWEHALGLGAEQHWILDDNIREFYRLDRNVKYRVDSGATFQACEDFVDRYENIALAGMDYEFFSPRRIKRNPFILNTRIYSCILIKNDLPYRWRGRYNEDTDLSLRILKDGWCTILFLAFQSKKIATMKMKGGNTDELYKDRERSRFEMALSLQQQHPDVVKIVCKWGRWQHLVNYKVFKNNQLIKKPGLVIPEGNNEYGMVLLKKAIPVST